MIDGDFIYEELDSVVCFVLVSINLKRKRMLCVVDLIFGCCCIWKGELVINVDGCLNCLGSV